MFRLGALAFPLLPLLLAELFLRLIGYGYSPHFFLPAKINGTNYFIENQKFSRRYFPPALARTPQPVLFAAEKPANTTRIFVLGESAAMGDPEPAFGMARILQLLLEEAFPGRRFEVINVAVTAINSHVIRQIAYDCRDKQGDFWVLYMGNNEVVGPFGAGTVFGAQAPGRAMIRASLALKATRVGQLFDAVGLRLGKSHYPTSWEGMEMFLKQQVRHDDPRMNKVYDHFAANLRDIVTTGRRSGAEVILSTVASNLKDCPPFASLHRLGKADSGVPFDARDWENRYLAPAEAESKTNYAAVFEKFRECQKLDDDYAELHFQMGRCLVGLGKPEEAKREFERARDLDALRFRADTHINATIRAATNLVNIEEAALISLIDAVDLFNRNNALAITGRELLWEHVHMNFDGNYLLARAFAEQIGQTLTNARRDVDNSPHATSWLTSAQCAQRLAFTDWDRLQLLEEMVRRLEQPPFTQQLDHKQQIATLKQQRDVLAKVTTDNQALDKITATYREAIALRPSDWVLRENFAKLLQSTGDPAGAEKQWREVLALLPHSEEALYSLGNVLDAQGKSAEALEYFNKALQKRPGSFEARNGLGVALSNQGKTDDAIAQYREALRRNPRFTEARVNLGQALAQLGREDEAIAEYRLALREEPNSSAAHINLGKLFAKQKRSAEAETEYQAALRINTNDAVAHYNFANLLVSEKRTESTEHFETAVRINPQFSEARYNLGLGYAAANRNADAIAQFKEVVRARPQWTEAHLNLGVALAKTGRYADAITEFNEVLRLDPQNADGKRFLEKAKELQQRN